MRLPELGKRGGNTSCFCTFCIQNQKKTWESVVNFPVDESFFFGGGRVLSRKPPHKDDGFDRMIPLPWLRKWLRKRVPRHFGFSEPGTPVAGMGVGWLASSVWKLGKQHR